MMKSKTPSILILCFMFMFFKPTDAHHLNDSNLLWNMDKLENKTSSPADNQQNCAVFIGIVNGDTEVCQGSPVSFTITQQAFSSGANAWERLDWTIDGVVHEEHTETIEVTFDAPGTYIIQLEAEDNSPIDPCIVSSNIINIFVNPLPTGNLVVVTPSICTGEDAQVLFDLQGSENTIFDVVFTTGLIEGYGSGSIISFPTPPGPLTYDVSATIITDKLTGCSNNIDSEGEIIVNSNPEIMVIEPCPISAISPLEIHVEEGTAPFNITLNINEETEMVSTFDNPYLTPDFFISGTNYAVSLEDANGCPSNMAFGIVECPCITHAGNINTTPINTCVEAPVTIIPPTDAVLDANDVLNYRLEGGGLSILFPSPTITFDGNLFVPESTYILSPIAGNDDGEGFVDLQDPCTVQSSSSVPITWHALPTASIQTDRDSICPSESLGLIISFEGTFDEYDVEITEINADGTTNILPSTQNIDSNPFSYTVTPSSESTTYIISELSYDNNSFSCTQSNLATLIVHWYVPPVIEAIVSDDDLQILNDITFTPNITLGSSAEIFTYEWEFPSADVMLLSKPLNNTEETVSYTEVGNKNITLTITDGNGCSHSFTENVAITPATSLYSIDEPAYQLELYPNPNKGHFQLIVNGTMTGRIKGLGKK